MKKSGVLMHISSLPSPYGIGTAGKAAFEFADFLHAAGQTLWQVLPLGPTGYGDSPYASSSVFACNPYFIDLDLLKEDGLLNEKDLSNITVRDEETADYGELYNNRFSPLKKAFSRFRPDAEYDLFCGENAFWLDSYAVFMAVKEQNGGVSWQYWKEGFRIRDTAEIEKFTQENIENINFLKFTQYMFLRQWLSLKSYVNSLGIKLIGDMPIYPAYDSSDVWASPENFQLDKNLLPKKVAGVPPDGFTADGQLWGNPLYDWGKMEEESFSWWVKRLKCSFRLFDIVRIDHFRGFESYYAVPYGDKTARFGKWEKGPGIRLFEVFKKEMPHAEIIAEDLGYLTKEVRDMVKATGFPGMKVLQFAFGGGLDNEYLPHNYTENCVVYTGTHDNDTLLSWYKTMGSEEKRFLKNYLKAKPNENVLKKLIESAFASNADTVIIPMQDYLNLGRSARMNKPSTLFINWKWRVKKDALNDKTAGYIKNFSLKYHRNGL